MKRLIKTLCLKKGKRTETRRQSSRLTLMLMALAMMMLAPQVMKAGDWSENGTKVEFKFYAYSNGQNFDQGDFYKKIRYSGSDQNLYMFDALGILEGYFAASGNFTTTGYRWYANGSGLLNYNHGQRYLSILKLFPGDEVTVHFSGTIYFISGDQANGKSSGDTMTSGTPYTITNTGSLDLAMPDGTCISSVTIKYNSTHIIWSGTQAGTKDGMPYYRYRLSTPSRDFIEPTPTIIPLGITVTGYTVQNYGTQVENKEVAVMDGNQVMFKNEGWAKVTATLSNGQTSSYLVEAWDNEAYYVLENNGTKYKLDKNPEITDDDQQGGVLKNRVVTAVPGVTMWFGIPRIETIDDETTISNLDAHLKPNTTVVYKYHTNNDNQDHMVSFTNDNNGWWDRFPNSNSDEPTQGTFYVFRATAPGTLKVGGVKDVRNGNRGSVIWVRFTDEGVYKDRGVIFPDNYDTGYMGMEYQDGINMEPGDVYYIHGDAYNGYWVNNQGQWSWVNDPHWSPFLLEWFSYEVEGGSGVLSLSNSYGVSDKIGYEIGNGGSITSTEVNASIPQGGSISIIEYKGNISSAAVSIDDDGHIVFSNIQFSRTGQDANGYQYMGGAIKVRLRNNAESDDYYFDYVFTIPYGKHIWDFRNKIGNDPGDGGTNGDVYTDEGLANDMKNNTTDLSRVYKVHQRESGVWTQLIDPLLVARGSVQGNNAFYLSNTNGLLVSAGAESFGTWEIGNQYGENYGENAEERLHGLKGIDDNVEYYFDYTTTTKADQMGLHTNGAKILFPGVKAGQYIKVWCHRHSDGSGETFTAENLMDLAGKPIDPTTTFQITGSGTTYNPRRLRGVIIFKVPETYLPSQDVSTIPALVLKDNGWTRFYCIEITDVYSTDQRSYIDEVTIDGTVDASYKGSNIALNNKGNIVYENTASVLFNGYGDSYVQNAWSPQFTVIQPEGSNVTYSPEFVQGSHDGNKWRNLKINITGGSGNLRIIQEMVTGGYVLDRFESWLAISQYHTQTYPYTWDFEAHNMSEPFAEGATNKSEAADAKSPYDRIDSTEDNNYYGRWIDGKLQNFSVDGENYLQSYTATRNNDLDYVNTTTSVSVTNAQLYDYYGTAKQRISQVIRPLFADGGELTYGAAGGPIVLKETEGLRIGMPRVGVEYWGTPAYIQENGRYEDYNGSLEMSSEGGLVITAPSATNLSGNHTTTSISIPKVDKSMYVFVKASAEPTVNGNAEKVENQFDLADNVYLYRRKGNDQKADVAFTFSNATIYKIGVTDIEKSINQLGYATESRHHAIDHTYTGEFTTKDVDAYAIQPYTGYQYNGFAVVQKSTNPIDVVPEETGVVLYRPSTTGRFSVPLFYPACNVAPSQQDLVTLAGNVMKANVDETVHDSETEEINNVEYTKFIMTTKYYTYHTNGDVDDHTDDSAPVEAFYRLRIDEEKDENTGTATAAAIAHNTIGANKAYMLIPTADLPKALWNGGNGQGKPTEGKNTFYIDLDGMFDDVDNDGITTGIGLVDTCTEEGTYYTISGVKLNGKPTQKGIYLCNGKKIYVK